MVQKHILYSTVFLHLALIGRAAGGAVRDACVMQKRVGTAAGEDVP